MKTTSLCILIALLFYTPVPCLLATTYYVDYVNGSDQNAGTSENAPIKTLTRISTLSLIPGDNVLLKCGVSWNDKFTVSTSGTSAAPITIGSYGTGARPVLCYYQKIFSYEWVDAGNGIYSYSTAEYTHGFFENYNKVKRASSAAMSDGVWYYDSTVCKLYYKPSGGTIAASTLRGRGNTILEVTGSYVVIDNLQFGYTGTHSISFTGNAAHETVKNCYLHHCYSNAVNFYYAGEGSRVLQNNMYKVGCGVYLVESGNNYVVSNNTIIDCNYEQYMNSDGHAIGMQNTNNSVFEFNHIENAVAPICLYVDAGETSSNNVIRYNYIANCKKTFSTTNGGRAILIVPMSANSISGNLVHDNIITNCNLGIKLDRTCSPSAPANCIYNNIVHDCVKGMMMNNAADNYVVKNNIFTASESFHISTGADVGSGNVLDSNCYYPDGDAKFYYGGNLNLSGWQSATGQDANSFALDPLFINAPANFNLSGNSPCIDAGEDVGLDYDFCGGEIVDFPDIGAHEFESQASLLPVLYYKFDQSSGNDVADTAFFGNTGTRGQEPRSPEWVNSLSGYDRCLNFTTGDFVCVPDTPSLSRSNGGFTLSILFYISENTGDHRVLVAKAMDSGAKLFNLQIRSSNVLWLRLADEVSGVNCGGPTVTTSTWYFLTVVVNFSSGVVSWYMGDTLVGTSNTNSIVPDLDTCNSIYIGAWDNTGAQGFAGFIDEVRIFDRPLSSSEISELW